MISRDTGTGWTFESDAHSVTSGARTRSDAVVMMIEGTPM
jgi:hypothetical protein